MYNDESNNYYIKLDPKRGDETNLLYIYTPSCHQASRYEGVVDLALGLM